MNARIKQVLTVFTAIALVVAVPLLATDFIWDGSGFGSGDGSEDWTNPSMWDVGSGYPDNSNDNATLADPSPTAECSFDLGSATTINDLALSGVSPTKMTLNVRDAALTVADFDLGDYGDLDVDRDFTVTSITTLTGESWIDVASSYTCDLGDVAANDAAAYLQATTSGTLQSGDVTVDAEAAAAARGLQFYGGTWTMAGKLLIKSSQTSGTNRAKLRIVAGTIDVAVSGATNGVLEIDGGNDSTRRAELDIDDTLTAEQTDVLSGYATIDVADGKTAYMGEYTLNGGAIVTVTGSGTVKSGSAP